ncbi:MAG: hypothetical protein RL181_915 [Bacteroidota bacterium]
MALLECVPNFSEGRNPEVIRQIADAVRAVPGVYLLHVDPGKAAHRTVFTFAGPPEQVVEAAFQGIKTASEHIDMSQHHGEHPRLGATDVCPLIPLEGISMEDCVVLAQKLGERVGRELQIPVFLYERAATTPPRRNLATIRAGEYEGLADKLQSSEWQPDFGPAVFNPRSGATVIGARDFLIAYNVNLNTDSAEKAHAIACEVRERGRTYRQADGTLVRQAGSCPAVKAIGWYIQEYGLAQVSMNLTDLSRTTLHEAFEACCKSAASHGLQVTGSELIGMVPLRVLLQAGIYFLKKYGRLSAVPEAEIIHAAVYYLGLDALAPFDPRLRVLEYRLEDLRVGG